MTAQLIPLAFEDNLVRVVKPNGEPWFVGKDVCQVLDISKHHQALDRLDEDERGAYTVGTPSGEQTMICINEPGVFRLIFTSRKPQAEAFKRWLAHEVLPALRKEGHYELPGKSDPAGEVIVEGEPLAVLQYKLSCVRESRLIHGPERARLLWDRLGLPKVPAGPELAIADGRACLAHLLDHVLIEDPHFGRPLTIRLAIEGALEDDGAFDAALRERGIRVVTQGEEGFIVGNAPEVEEIFRGSRWAERRWRHALAHLPGARKVGPTKFSSAIAHRGTFLPADAAEPTVPLMSA